MVEVVEFKVAFLQDRMYLSIKRKEKKKSLNNLKKHEHFIQKRWGVHLRIFADMTRNLFKFCCNTCSNPNKSK